ncbi:MULTISPECIES: Sir2 family NAD-dependent protein deacetylase [unclassified Chelatococcus]|uniref:SIR2 family NAD-dependent protein deacylase n=1 Tax=unclassified Chelatococcus TaxID=2638111 RepID=UPI0006853867|nr:MULTISPECIES: Sir2 family NAD-dependent protein deacetylase [unclassified Chelatococcus]
MTASGPAALDEDLEVLAEWLASAEVVAPFTGAGISTESGVPDFRSPGSPWLTNQPIAFDAFLASAEARREAWRRKFAMDDLYAGAAPGRGHHFLAGLVASGKAPAIITQNIDGLQQAAGVPEDRVIELHGNGTYAACLDCAQRQELAEIRPAFETSGQPPACPHCGGIIKSATISFGQTLPQAALQRALALAGASDLFIAIGSSLLVHPAAGLPVLAKRHGARLVIINREATPLDEIADLVLNGEIGAICMRLAELSGDAGRSINYS